jgi:hypothetical protein
LLLQLLGGFDVEGNAVGGDAFADPGDAVLERERFCGILERAAWFERSLRKAVALAGTD